MTLAIVSFWVKGLGRAVCAVRVCLGFLKPSNLQSIVCHVLIMLVHVRTRGRGAGVFQWHLTLAFKTRSAGIKGEWPGQNGGHKNYFGV